MGCSSPEGRCDLGPSYLLSQIKISPVPKPRVECLRTIQGCRDGPREGKMVPWSWAHRTGNKTILICGHLTGHILQLSFTKVYLIPFVNSISFSMPGGAGTVGLDKGTQNWGRSNLGTSSWWCGEPPSRSGSDSRQYLCTTGVGGQAS